MPDDPLNNPGATAMSRLLAVMARLRTPETGCPWDLEQDFATIAPYTIEEAYEVAEAIAEGDMAALRDELGDLLFQVVFYARMAEEREIFDFDDVALEIAEKMIRRHPHVFTDEVERDVNRQKIAWETQKAEERARKAAAKAGEGGESRARALDGVSIGLPALTRAVKLQNRAARVGFDWPDKRPVLAKIDEELAELKVELDDGGSQERIAEEFGDFLFVIANLARHLKLDPEDCLRAANRKFSRRFAAVEDKLASDGGRTPADSNLAEMDSLWTAVKAEEQGA